jgi:aminoglycoside phosphotransferase (APT) family kinase protein
MADASLPTDPALSAFLAASGLLRDPASAVCTPLTGGVASDIWKVEAEGKVFAVKRALEKLRVAQDWHVPTSRNAAEVAWLRTAGTVVPAAVPLVLAHDPQAGLFAMEFLDPATHPAWKTQLRQGRADPSTAAAVGRVLAAIHAATAYSARAEQDFANAGLFYDIRLEPYLEATARVHADLAGPLLALAQATLAARIALMHGDVSPKNILIGPAGPVFLDAECACFGDPAFDVAFCLNHLLLKCVWVPAAMPGFLACFQALSAAYFAGATWEPRAGLEWRIARLLPALLLARVDGKSPVEYLGDADRAAVRRVARTMIAAPPADLAAINQAWAGAFGAPGRDEVQA